MESVTKDNTGIDLTMQLCLNISRMEENNVCFIAYEISLGNMGMRILLPPEDAPRFASIMVNGTQEALAAGSKLVQATIPAPRIA